MSKSLDKRTATNRPTIGKAIQNAARPDGTQPAENAVATASENKVFVLDDDAQAPRFKLSDTHSSDRAPAAYQVTQRRRRRRWGALLGFLLVVAAPTSATAYYFWKVATPQFVSEFQFGVRSADSARNNSTAIFNGMAAASQIGLDSYMIVEFIKSRSMLEQVATKLEFEKIFARDSIDQWSRLKPQATDEEKLDYWQGMVEPYFDLTTGAIFVRVYAFDPDTSRLVGEIILQRSTELVNEMSQQIRDDALNTAKKEVSEAESRLKQAVSALQAFRDSSSRIDPGKEADAGLSSTKALRDEIGRLKAQLAVQRSYLSNKSPAVVATERRIGALETELSSLRKTLTTDNPGSTGTAVLSEDIGTFSTLTLDQRFAEEYYSSALTSLNRAKLTAEQQVSYLAVFVKPSTPSSSTFPDPVRLTLIAFAASLGLWLFLLILFKSIRER